MDAEVHRSVKTIIKLIHLTQVIKTNVYETVDSNSADSSSTNQTNVNQPK